MTGKSGKSPEEIAEITGGDIKEIRAAFESVRIIRAPENTDTEDIATHVRSIAARNDLTLDKVIVYGSVARQEATSESDVDLVVVSADFVDVGFHERAGGIYWEWDTDRYPVPDLIALTPEEFEQRRMREGDVVQIAAQQGLHF
ncbi:nucleotidyltransferase domain-containing protein [Halogeometricum luteum]|uniref:Nucleotidyltransferase domain-containing protein n=1 Tax=Halogeometricum luteum TaxID=2950537 RepID=A0ABU2G6Y0_9EURY|nr:nucleotidyltransferase domain-containing protein [Halogeometricum sp. S3BR5-2]MDS0296547.1 nucleotidyltransferase domain-containing protein [Halogeometricum sp. S3BR5-2]